MRVKRTAFHKSIFVWWDSYLTHIQVVLEIACHPTFSPVYTHSISFTQLPLMVPCESFLLPSSPAALTTIPFHKVIPFSSQTDQISIPVEMFQFHSIHPFSIFPRPVPDPRTSAKMSIGREIWKQFRNEWLDSKLFRCFLFLFKTGPEEYFFKNREILFMVYKILIIITFN